jgi:hypothetical protein
MGMFDSFYVTLNCPTCKKTALREVQTKAFANALFDYRPGDIVDQAPIGEYWLKETWWCSTCKEKNRTYEFAIFLHIIDSLFIGAYSPTEVQQERTKHIDTYQIMRQFHKSATLGTKRGQLLRRIFHLISGFQSRQKASLAKRRGLPAKLDVFSITPQNHQELFQDILDLIKQTEKNRLKDHPGI